MIEQVEYKGEWSVPNKGIWYSGVLTFSPEDGADLEIYGSFYDHFLDRKEPKIIIGKTSKGDVTLVDNIYKSTKHTHSTGITISQYAPSCIIIGHHFTREEKMLFRSASFRLFNLFEWLSVTGIKFHSNNNIHDYSLEYLKPPSIKFEYFENCDGKIAFNSPVRMKDINNKVEIEEQSTVTLTYGGKRALKDILMDIYIFSGFVTLNTFEQSYATKITFCDEDYDEGNRPKLISCLYNNPTYSSKYRNRRKGEHLIQFSDIKEEFPVLIKNWYQRYHEIKPVFSLMLYSFKEKLKFNEDKFMDVVRAIETFHRRTQNNSRIPDSQFQLKIERILEKVDSEDKQWLSEKLKYTNEPSLRKRLIELINNYSNSYLQSKLTDINAFCNDVVNSRNYYTHYSHELENVALKGNALFELNQNLMGLLISCIYKHIGLRDNIIENGLIRVY